MAENAKRSKERSKSPWLLRLLFIINVAIHTDTGYLAIRVLYSTKLHW